MMVIGEDQYIIAEMIGIMGVIMEPLEGTNVVDLATKLLPLVIGPIVTAIFKRVMTSIPASWVPIVSAIVGALTGAMTSGASVVTDVAVGAGLGLGGAKARDLAVGKPRAVPQDFDNA